ncbi:hypothetical protein HDU81_000859 [Chytriomyces hyalinus]|nr:hypothetical protein HDU81_000859 [Chytriomyces hyalinus]
MFPTLALALLALQPLVLATCPFLGSIGTHLTRRSENWSPTYQNTMTSADWQNLKLDIQAQVLQAGEGPAAVRLAWHDAGTYTLAGSGGPHAQKRFISVAQDSGLSATMSLLEPLKTKYPQISYADLWSFAGAVAVANSGGPSVKWRPNRADAVDVFDDPFTANDLPIPQWNAAELKRFFYAKGFNDREIVALTGGHCLGGVPGLGPWTSTPLVFNNAFFVLLNNPNQYTAVPNGFRNRDGLIMLPSDMALIEDPTFAQYVRQYAQDEEVFFNDFASAWEKLSELGITGGLGQYVDVRVGSGSSGSSGSNSSGSNGSGSSGAGSNGSGSNGSGNGKGNNGPSYGSGYYQPYSPQHHSRIKAIRVGRN